jgi:hypothetical protein
LVLEGEEAFGPALPPEADGVGMEFDASAGLDVGEQGAVVQEQDEASPLAEVSGGGAAAQEAPGLGEEVGRETGTVGRQRAGHETILERR